MVYECIVYDKRDEFSSDPSSTLGFRSTLNEARDEIRAYWKQYPEVVRFEIRDATGKLIRRGDRIEQV